MTSFFTASGDSPWTHVHHGIVAGLAPFAAYGLTLIHWDAPITDILLWSLATFGVFGFREIRQKQAKILAGTWSEQWWRDLVDDLVGPGTATWVIGLFTLTWSLS